VNGFSPVVKLEHGSRASSALNQGPTDCIEHRNAAMTFLTSTTAALLIMASQPIPATASTVSPLDFGKYFSRSLPFKKSNQTYIL
jgi:hypothetical protein